MTLGLDIDGVFAEFCSRYAKFLAEENGKDLMPVGWQDNVEIAYPVWNWDSHHGYSNAIQSNVWRNKILSSPTFWATLSPMPTARESIRFLNTLSKNDHKIYFLTHRMGHRAKQQTEEWLYGIGMHYPTVLLSEDKVALVRALKIDTFVDDKLETCNDMARVAEGEGLAVKDRVFMVSAPYNQEGRHDGVRVVDSVKHALQEAGLWH